MAGMHATDLLIDKVETLPRRRHGARLAAAGRPAVCARVATATSTLVIIRHLHLPFWLCGVLLTGGWQANEDPDPEPGGGPCGLEGEVRERAAEDGGTSGGPRQGNPFCCRPSVYHAALSWAAGGERALSGHTGAPVTNKCVHLTVPQRERRDDWRCRRSCLSCGCKCIHMCLENGGDRQQPLRVLPCGSRPVAVVTAAAATAVQKDAGQHPRPRRRTAQGR